jgi:hypothetical protein
MQKTKGNPHIVLWAKYGVTEHCRKLLIRQSSVIKRAELIANTEMYESYNL